MDINRVQGANAYAGSRPLAENNLVQEQNREASETDLNRENTRPIQEAFEVTITQEAREQQAAATEDREQPPLPEPQQNAEQGQGPERQQPSQIVNIVA